MKINNIIKIIAILLMAALSLVIIIADFSEEIHDILWSLVHIVLFVFFGYLILNKIGITESKSKKDEDLENDPFDVSSEQKKTKNGMILSTSIKRKRLCYNPNEFRQVLELTAILRYENFVKIQNRLSESNMRKGFCCLFYGPPGTGKTETSYQIALETGRDIIPIDISQIQSKHPGEGQKNIKAIFGRYRYFSKESNETPILLLNEADAIINKRTIITNKNPALEKDDNAMQNVLLQEMEDFDGILIATTNLTENFDNAFNRRFLYKIKFSVPDKNTRADIWETIIPSLREQEARELAVKYNFSGGQIENIARKSKIESILSGNNLSMDRMKYYCQEEMLSSENEKRIGFIV
jgi:ATP-dependent Zn protease